jgi:dTMP kinase
MGISPAAELMLFNASRAQLIAEVIRPALESGKVVICDRFMDSTTAYQGYGRRLDLAMVKTVNAIAVQGLNPHLTILMDLDVATGLARKGKKKQDRFEREEIAFHRRVREGYLTLAREEPGRWLILDAAQPKNKISGAVWQKVSQMLAGKRRA